MKEDINIKEEYNELAKKHKLPKFDDINEDFELEFIKEKSFLLRQIRRRINEKVIFFCRIIEGLLYPTQQHIINVTEMKNLPEEKKKYIEKMYRDLMYLERESLLLDVVPNDKKDAGYINNVFNFWSKMRKQVEDIVRIMQESWKKEDITKEKNNYFG